MSRLREDFRSLAYNLCEKRELPLLVTDLIAEYLVYRDLFNISILSRSLSAEANAIIYRDIVVDLDGSERCVRKASLLFRTLLTSEAAAQAVRTLSLAGDPLQDWRNRTSRIQDGESVEGPLRGVIPPGMYTDLTGFTRGEIELYQQLAASMRSTIEVPVWALRMCAIRLTTVQTLSVSSDYFRFLDFRSAWQDMVRDASMIQLRSCSSCLDLLHGKRRHASVVKDWDGALLTPIVLSGIESFAAVVSLESEAVRQLRPGGSSITRLTLHHYQIQDFDLSSLLAATPNLRYLKYHASIDYAWATSPRRNVASKHGVGLEPLFHALHRVGHSFKSFTCLMTLTRTAFTSVRATL